MELKLWKDFRKRRNSTKQPTTEPDAVKEVRLKDKCTITNPSFFLADAELYSYVQWKGMYYFIKEVAWDINGHSYIICQLDYLATWKDEILNTSAFVKYSSSDYNTKIRDDRIPVTAQMVCNHETELSMFTSTQSYILTAANMWGGIHHYCLTESECKWILNYLSWYSETDEHDPVMERIAEALTRQFGDFMASIISLVRVPILHSKMVTSQDFVALGAMQVHEDYESTTVMTVDVAEDSNVYEVHEIAIPWHYTDFRKGKPYQFLSVALPFLGEVELEPSDFYDTGVVKIRTDVCIYTGGITYTIYSDKLTKPVATYKATCGLEIPVSAVTLGNVNSMVGTAAEGLAGFALAGSGMGAPMGLASVIHAGVSGFFTYNQHKAQHVGSYSGTNGEYGLKDYSVMVRYYPCANEPSNLTDIAGRPCLKVRQIQGLTGYVETIGFSIQLHSTDDVKSTINTMMDSGVYIE